MCKILAILNTKEENNATLQELIHLNAESLATQPDGYSVYRKGEGTKFYIEKEAYEKEALKTNLQYNGENVFITHFRIATAGKMADVSGLHLHAMANRYIWAHNGTVDAFSGVRKRNDSFYFFLRMLTLWDEVTNENIAAAIEQYGFSGKGFLFDEKEDTLHFFNNFGAYIYLFDGAIVISTWKLETEIKAIEYHSTLGYMWTKNIGRKKIEGLLHSEEIDNKYLKFTKSLMTEEGYIPNRKYNYNNGRYGQGYTVYGRYDEEDYYLDSQLIRDQYEREGIEVPIELEKDLQDYEDYMSKKKEETSEEIAEAEKKTMEGEKAISKTSEKLSTTLVKSGKDTKITKVITN